MKALISIDYTYDFVATDGKLTTGEYGQQIEEALVKVTKDFIENDDFVVFAIDGLIKKIIIIQKINYSRHII